MATRSARLEEQDCSIARALSVIGERWTLLILRDVFLGLQRFDEMQRSLGIARNILADRLAVLVEEGVLERVPYQDRPVRHAYRLTAKGIDLQPVLTSLQVWGDKHDPAPGGPPRRLVHATCAHTTRPKLACSHCGEVIVPGELRSPLRRRRA